MIPLYGKCQYPGQGNTISWSAAEVTAAPDEFPVTLREAKLNSRQDPDPGSMDALWKLWIRAAAGFVENEARHLILPRQMRFTFDRWPSGTAELELPMAPLRTIESITYKDETGVDITMPIEDYDYWLDANPPFVWPTLAWPTRYSRSVVTIVAEVGYTDRNLVPPTLKQAALVLTSAFEANPTLVDKNGDVRSLRAVRSLAVAASLGGYP